MFVDMKSLFFRDTCHIAKDSSKLDSRKYPANYRMVSIALLLILLIILAECSGLLDQSIRNEQEHLMCGEKVQYVSLSGTVVESKKGQSYFFMETDGGVRVYVTIPYESYDATTQRSLVWYPMGTRLEMYGALSLPDGARNPGGFDESVWLRSKQTGIILDAQQIQLIAEPKGVWNIVYRLQLFMESVLCDTLSDNQANLAMALLTGAKHRLDDGFYNITQQMGIAHIFAVSGLHVGVIGTALLFFFRQWGWMQSWVGFFLLGAMLSVYCMLAGLPASAIRAACMILLSALAVRLYRPVNSINFLSFAGIALLLDNPFLLWSAGFQLSFGVTLSLLLFVSPIQKKMHRIPFAWLRSSVAVVFAAWIGSLPLTAWHFYTITPISPIFNFILVPLVSLTVPILLIALFSVMICPAGAWLWMLPAKLLLSLLQSGTMWLYTIAEHIFGTIQWNIGRPDGMALLLYAVLIVLLWYWLCKTQWMMKRYASATMGTLLLMILCLCVPTAPNTDTLLYLDTGQGSCALFRTKSGEVVLFDAGAQKQEVASVLAWYGINKINAVILSHSDTDHINGLAQVMQTVRIEQIYMEPHQIERETMRDLLVLANDKGIHSQAITTKATLYLQHHSIDLQPFMNDTDSTNGMELTAVLQYAKGAVAFPGDLGYRAVEKFVTMQDCITIWTVPHHGSRYSGSEELYRMLKQKGVQYAVISAGRDNHYGHPHQELLRWTDTYQIRRYVTAQEGAILFLLQ